MLFDYKKLFDLNAPIGRFDYFKIVFGFLVIPPILTCFLWVSILTNDFLCIVLGLIALIFMLLYTVISYIASYKRLLSILNNKIIITTLCLLFLFISLLRPFIFNLIAFIFLMLLIFVPAKKETYAIISNKLFYWTLPLVILTAIFCILPENSVNYLRGNSMADTILVGDRIFTNISRNSVDDYKRGDIITYQFKDNITFVKRIIGLPNEKFELKIDKNTGIGTVYINDKPLNEPYVKDVTDYKPCDEKTICEPIMIPENKYLVLGDNRGNSFDSRYKAHGLVDIEQINGRVHHVFFPFKHRKLLVTPSYDVNID